MLDPSIWNLGPSITGGIIGSPYAQFRGSPGGASIGTVNAWITTDDTSKARKADAFGKPVWTSLHDTTQTAVGDYLIGPLGTFFIASQDVPMPIQVVRCNCRVALYRPDADASGVGALAPGGQTAATDTALFIDWPAAITIKTRGETGEAQLPGDTKLALFEILLPATVPALIRTSDLVVSNELPQLSGQRRFTLSAAELSPLGWRLYAQLSVT